MSATGAQHMSASIYTFACYFKVIVKTLSSAAESPGDCLRLKERWMRRPARQPCGAETRQPTTRCSRCSKLDELYAESMWNHHIHTAGARCSRTLCRLLLRQIPGRTPQTNLKSALKSPLYTYIYEYWCFSNVQQLPVWLFNCHSGPLVIITGSIISLTHLDQPCVVFPYF